MTSLTHNNLRFILSSLIHFLGDVMKKQIIIVLMLLIMPLAACSNVPENGSVLNSMVSQGIAKNQLETEKIIKALADVERAVLNEKWDDIYEKTEAKYVADRGLNVNSLTHEQRRAIAANSSQVYFSLKAEIATIEAGLVAQTQANSNAIIAVNDTVTEYLLSLEKLDVATGKIRNKISSVTGIDFSVIIGKAVELISKL